jgi:long-chain acyl-CoA synthetase
LLPITDENQHEVAISDAKVSRTWRELDNRAAQIANALREMNVGHGAHFAVLMRNRVAWIEMMLGNLLAGSEYVPVNWHLAPAEVAYILEDSEARFLLHDDVNRELAEAAAALVGGVQLIDVDVEWEERIARSSEHFDPPVAAGGVLLYTGGSTGRPKAVVRSEVRSVPLADFPEFNRRNAIGRWHFPEEIGVFLGVCPLYHSAPGGLTLYSIFLGYRVVILDRFDAQETLAAIERERITMVILVPTQIIRLLRLPQDIKDQYDLSSLTYVLHGAAPCPRWAKEALIEWFGPIVWEYYGAVEGTGPFVCDSRTYLERPGTVGKPPKDFAVWVEDESGNRLGAGEVGELWYQNERGFPMYHKDPVKTAAAVRPDGAYRIGDFGYFDEDGYLFIADRRSDMIVSGGVNVYPVEIEAALSEHPSVRDVAVVGLEDEEWGKRLHAIVVLDDGAVATAEDLDAHCRARIASFKCPKSYDFVAKLPRDESGKLRRHLIRDGVVAPEVNTRK